jgi:hypothetical protein
LVGFAKKPLPLDSVFKVFVFSTFAFNPTTVFSTSTFGAVIGNSLLGC